MIYIAIIHKDDGSDWGVCFPDFPGCVTAGESIEQARDLATEALNSHIEMMIEEKLEIPQPSKLDDIMKDQDYSDGLAFLVESSIPTSSI